MLVVIAVLFYLGIFSPKTGVPKSCTLPSGLTCVDHGIYANGNLYLDLGQAMGSTVNVTQISCTSTGVAANVSSSKTIDSGLHTVVAGSGVLNVSCNGTSGQETFKGKVRIYYTLSTSSSVTRYAEGDISDPVGGVQ
jgi:hypothetical protein